MTTSDILACTHHLITTPLLLECKTYAVKNILKVLLFIIKLVQWYKVYFVNSSSNVIQQHCRQGRLNWAHAQGPLTFLRGPQLCNTK